MPLTGESVLVGPPRRKCMLTEFALDDSSEKRIWEPLAARVGLTHIAMVKLRWSIATCAPRTSPVPVNFSAPTPILPGVTHVGPAEMVPLLALTVMS